MNRRGQAMLEALVTSSVWSLGFLFLLKAALAFGTQLLLDDWTDEFLLCRDEACELKMKSQLKNFGVSDFQATATSPGKIILLANTKILGQLTIKKEIDFATPSQ